LLQPGFSYLLDFCGHRAIAFWFVRALNIFHRFDELSEHRLGIT
jgi:hypothetical protein